MMWLPLVFYGVLTLVTVWATCAERDLCWLGRAIAFSFILSNVTWFIGPPEVRPGIYTMTEVFIALAAFIVWTEHHSRSMVALVAIAALSIAANVAFALTEARPGQVYIYEVITNIFFSLECLIAIGAGISHGRRTGRFGHRSHRRDNSTQPNAVHQEKAQ